MKMLRANRRGGVDLELLSGAKGVGLRLEFRI